MIYSKVSGNGLPLVFIHGFGEDLTIWNGLIGPLTVNYQFIALDLPGFGQSSEFTTDFNLDQIAIAVRDHLVNNLKITEAIVFGHSLGGYVALALAEKYPEMIMGFGLINSTSLADSPEKKSTRLKTADFIAKHGTSFFMDSFVPNLFTAHNRKILKSEVESVLKISKKVNEATLMKYMHAMRNRPDRSFLLEKSNHVLFVGGALDPHFSQSDHDFQLSLLKETDFGVIIPEVAHMSMFEAPSLLTNSIIHFVKSIKND